MKTFNVFKDMKKVLLIHESTSIPIKDDIKSHIAIHPNCEQLVNLVCNYREFE